MPKPLEDPAALIDPIVLAGVLSAPRCAHWIGRLGDLRAPASGGAARPLSCLEPSLVAELLLELADSALRGPLLAALGPAPLCDIDQAFVRSGRPPHRWHQDGALRHDFLAAGGTGGLLPMITCWIALTACGASAPALEWVDGAAAAQRLLGLADLHDDAVTRRLAAGRLVQPVLDAGDALLFDGRLLHRTHLRPEMDRERVSLELRFVGAGAVPLRLAGDQLLAFR